MFLPSFSFLLFSLSIAVRSQDLSALALSRPEAWEGRVHGNTTIERNLIIKNGVLSAEKLAPLYIFSKAALPIEAGTTAVLRGKFRVETTFPKDAKFFFAIACYDRAGRMIQGANVKGVIGSESVLLSDAPEGTRQLCIRDASGWLKKSGSVAAFHCQNEYLDLPNFNLSPAVTHIMQQENGWIVTLRHPMKTAIPAGTRVRQHIGAAYLYAASSQKLSTERKEFSKTFQGIAFNPANQAENAFHPGTASAKIVIFTTGQPADLQMQDVELSPIK